MGVSLLSLFMSFSLSSAVVLQPINDSSVERLPLDSQAPIACSDVYTRLARYHEMARQHDQSVSLFLNEVAGKVSEWHAILSPLEGRTRTIPEGTFSPLLDGSERISLVSGLAFENSALLAEEMDRILQAVGRCVKEE